MAENKPLFCSWLHWDRRGSCICKDRPGVYLLGRFDEGPPEFVDPLDRRIILIAETHDQTLQRRWDQFHYAAFRGKSGHAGGATFHRLYANGPDTETPPWLFVSAAPVPLDVGDCQGYVQETKNRLLQRYEDEHGFSRPVTSEAQPRVLTFHSRQFPPCHRPPRSRLSPSLSSAAGVNGRSEVDWIHWTPRECMPWPASTEYHRPPWTFWPLTPST